MTSRNATFNTYRLAAFPSPRLHLPSRSEGKNQEIKPELSSTCGVTKGHFNQHASIK